MSRIIHTESSFNKQAKVFAKNEYDEYLVRLFLDGRPYKPADYFTDDRDDAYGTARLMVAEASILEDA